MKTLTILTYVELACSWLVAKGHYTWLTIGDKRRHYSLSELVKMGREFVAEHPDFVLETDDSADEANWIELATGGNIKVDFKKNDISMRPLFTRENGMDFFKERANNTLVEWLKVKYPNKTNQ